MRHITEITRRNILDYLILSEHPFHGRLDLVSFLNRVFDLSSMPSTDRRFSNARDDIHQHMINNFDWEVEYLLLTYLDMLRCDDSRFLSFLEETIHPIVQADETKVKELLKVYNANLQQDRYAIIPSNVVSGKTIYKATQISSAYAKKAYDIVLSYASEDREYVEFVAQYLSERRIQIFYDRDEAVDLWGKDLTEHLDKIFRRSGARFCVVFISKHYVNKMWTRHEWRSAYAKAVEERGEYILPARFDDTNIPDLRPSIVYVDLREKTPQEFGEMIIKKLENDVGF